MKTTNRAVKTSCKNTKVRSASGSCVSERPSFKKGGLNKSLPKAQSGMTTDSTKVSTKYPRSSFDNPNVRLGKYLREQTNKYISDTYPKPNIQEEVLKNYKLNPASGKFEYTPSRKKGGTTKSLPKAQTGGGVIITPKGKIVRGTPETKTMPGGKRSTIQSIDTTGYSKGKKTFDLITRPNVSIGDHSGPIILKNGKPIVKVTKVQRADVNKTISNLKKGATKTTDLRTKKKG